MCLLLMYTIIVIIKQLRKQVLFMKFTFEKNTPFNYGSPSEMYNDYKQRQVNGLLDYQSNIISKFMNEYKNNETHDYAIELPTGSGKTLVGLLIGEFLRRKELKKVVYVCLNNQLVNQVAAEAKSKYAIPVATFTGKFSDYNNEDYYSYNNNNKIAITNYNAIFNSKSRFKNADLIIFDDVHNANSPILNNWSLTVNKSSYEDLYIQLTDILKDVVSENAYHHLTNVGQQIDDSWVDMLPMISFYKIKKQIRSILDKITNTQSEIYYPWQNIKDHLQACNLYMSESSIQICPQIAPTQRIPAFEHASVRIYMSATLGDSGELERSFGITDVCNVSLGKKENPRIGRRLFLFPDMKFKDENKDSSLFLKLHPNFKRSVCLVNSNIEKIEFEQRISSDLKNTMIYDGHDLQDGMDNFENSQNAIAILANRYDGVSFSEESSHLLLIKDLPPYISLQDNFFASRMKAAPLLNERLVSRITQAVGRCTRSAMDFAVVIIEGNSLEDILTNRTKQELFPAELRAELTTGLAISQQIEKFEDMEETAEMIFNQKNDDWASIENQIITERDEFENVDQDGNKDVLKKFARNEIIFEYCMWDDDFEGATKQANKIVDIIKKNGETNLNGVKFYWQYIVNSLNLMRQEKGSINYQNELDSFNNFLKSTRNISWFNELSNSINHKKLIDGDSTNDERIATMVSRIEENIQNKFHDFNLTRRREKIRETTSEILNVLENGNGVKYETAIEQLGQWLGFKSGNSKKDGAPDPWWFIDNKLVIVSEIKILKENTRISKKHVDEASGHVRFLINDSDYPEFDNTVTYVSVFISNSNKIENDAQKVAPKEMYYLNTDTIIKFAKRALPITERIYDEYSSNDDYMWLKDAEDIIRTSIIAPNNIYEEIKNKKLISINVE